MDGRCGRILVLVRVGGICFAGFIFLVLESVESIEDEHVRIGRM